jgi:hypothetical protein
VTRRLWLIVGVIAVVIAALVVRNQIKVEGIRQARAVAAQEFADPAGTVRRALLDLLQPVALANCDLQRFGEPNDGGYVMCGNLLGNVQAGYSYGISGYDQWGCDISTTLGVRVHQYDCFNTKEPSCLRGDTVFHAACIADTTFVEEGRPFDTFQNHFASNGDAGKRLVLKIDVEGAEWNAFLGAADSVIDQFEQIAVEFHHSDDPKYVHVVTRLKQRFHVAHLHFNNYSCVDYVKPFPAEAYEVLFVNKRIAVVDVSKQWSGLQPADAPNNPTVPDCQAAQR